MKPSRVTAQMLEITELVVRRARADACVAGHAALMQTESEPVRQNDR